MVQRTARNFFEDFDQDELHKQPLAFTTFAIQTDEDIKPYFMVSDGEKLSKILNAKLSEYNESFARMDLVLFVQAMEHICRISRIIDTPRGNALLVGVGGSGKQSLTRLAAFISGHAVFQVKLTQQYGMADFKQDVYSLYSSTGLKGNSIVFLCLEASDAGRLLPVADAATLRCLQWLASGLPPVDRGVTVDAVRQNLRDGCGVTATEAQVAGWLSR